MDICLALAARGLGVVWPNPAVGCVLVKDGAVVGRGWTQPGGRPHAETEALRRAGDAAKGATIYVSLEPCAHHGQTPPCVDAIIDAGVQRAVVATVDPDERINGDGIARLKEAGLDVATGVRAEQAAALNAGFMLRISDRRPLVTLKLATTLDGQIATHSGESRWITGPAARARGHLMRAQHDAIMVGGATALSDDPELTCRLPGLKTASPVRVVLDSRMQLPLTSRLAQTAADVPTWILVAPSGDSDRRHAFEDCGVEIIEAETDESGLIAIAAALRALAERGITRLLVEGGGRVSASLLRAGLVDRLAWFRATSVIGGDGKSAIAAFGVDILSEAPVFDRVSVETVGNDILETYVRST